MRQIPQIGENLPIVVPPDHLREREHGLSVAAFLDKAGRATHCMVDDRQVVVLLVDGFGRTAHLRVEDVAEVDGKFCVVAVVGERRDPE